MVTKEMINLTEFAVMLGVGEMTVRRMVYRGDIGAVKVGGRWLINEKQARDFVEVRALIGAEL